MTFIFTRCSETQMTLKKKKNEKKYNTKSYVITNDLNSSRD